jgi:hypothetical protein
MSDAIELTIVHEEEESPRCGYCGSSKLSTTIEYIELPYGESGPGQAMVPCSMPVRHCDLCGFEYTDWEGEEARQEAVDSFLESNPYSCDCGWRGSKPIRINFGEIHCPECNKIATVRQTI